MRQDGDPVNNDAMSEAVTDETEQPPADDSDGTDGDTPDRATLAAQVDLLREENRRLREEYTRARRSNYRRTALGLALVGAVAVGAGVLFPGTRTVLFALGATGIFGALLTYYLTPERFIAVSVGEAIYRAFAGNGRALADDLGLGEPVYVPREVADDVRLYVPQAEADGAGTFPEDDALDPGFVIGDETRGLALVPTGDTLFEEFERSLTGPLAGTPGTLAEQLADGLVEQFELVDGADVDANRERVTVGISGSAYGAVGRFDHPVASFLAGGFARAFDVPADVTVTEADGRADVAVTVRPAGEDGTFSTDSTAEGDAPEGSADQEAQADTEAEADTA
jgi:hypothetical protein